MTRTLLSLLLTGVLSISATAQTEAAFDQSPTEASRSLLDASRFHISHSLNFGMSSSSSSDLKSQSLYATMISYRFAKPVTLSLNFGLPIHSTYSSAGNLNMDNIESLDYFKNMPFDVSLAWQPREDMVLRLNVSRFTPESRHFNSLRYEDAYYGLGRENRFGW